MRKVIRGVFALIAIVLISLWMLTQPIFDRELQRGNFPAQTSAVFLRSHVENIVAFGPRNAEKPETLEKVATYIEQQFQTNAAKVSRERFEVDKNKYSNVYGEYGPDSEEAIVLGAHYDAAGPYPGADDNASGVSALLEISRVYAKTPPPKKVILAAYSLEEMPYFRSKNMGSAFHARALKKSGTKIKVMMSLEMLGYFSDEPESQHFPVEALGLLYPHVGNFIAIVSTPSNLSITREVKRGFLKGSSLPVYSINAPREIPGIDFSDHLSFLDAGIPAVMITDTADNRNLAYHTAMDTADLLDYERMRMAVDACLYAVNSLLTS